MEFRRCKHTWGEWRAELGRAAAAGFVVVNALTLPAAPVCAQPMSPKSAVLTDRDAFLLLPAEIISGPVVQRSSVSPLGGNVAVLRQWMRISAANFPSAAQPRPGPPQIEQELIFWNATLRKPVSLWQTSQPLTQVSLSDWLPNTESLFALVDQAAPPDPQQPGQLPTHEWKLLLLGNGIERARIVPLPVGRFEYISVHVSPRQPLAILEMTPSGPNQPPIFVLVHPNARVGSQVQLPQALHHSLRWDASGSPVFEAYRLNDSNESRDWLGVDVRTGQTRRLEKEPTWPDERAVPSAALPFHLVSRPQTVTSNDTTDNIRSLWLESGVRSEQPRALIAADGTEVSLLPDAGGAVFTSQNALWFTPIVRVSKVDFLTLRRKAQIITVISNAKQLGLAAIMFAQDNDEVLPGPEGIQDKLSAYLKNDSLFEGFTYTYPGGAMADIASPSETVLGHVSGPGGQAVLYADGHVKWMNQ